MLGVNINLFWCYIFINNPIGFLDLGDMNIDNLFFFSTKNHGGVILGY